MAAQQQQQQHTRKWRFEDVLQEEERMRVVELHSPGGIEQQQAFEEEFAPRRGCLGKLSSILCLDKLPRRLGRWKVQPSRSRQQKQQQEMEPQFSFQMVSSGFQLAAVSSPVSDGFFTEIDDVWRAKFQSLKQDHEEQQQQKREQKKMQQQQQQQHKRAAVASKKTPLWERRMLPPIPSVEVM